VRADDICSRRALSGGHQRHTHYRYWRQKEREPSALEWCGGVGVFPTGDARQRAEKHLQSLQVWCKDPACPQCRVRSTFLESTEAVAWVLFLGQRSAASPSMTYTPLRPPDSPGSADGVRGSGAGKKEHAPLRSPHQKRTTPSPPSPLRQSSNEMRSRNQGLKTAFGGV